MLLLFDACVMGLTGHRLMGLSTQCLSISVPILCLLDQGGVLYSSLNVDDRLQCQALSMGLNTGVLENNLGFCLPYIPSPASLRRHVHYPLKHLLSGYCHNILMTRGLLSRCPPSLF